MASILSFLKRYQTLFLLGLSLIFGAILRFHHIAKRALWLDEAESANLIHSSFSGIWTRTVEMNSNLLHVYLLKFWSFLAGDSEFGLRLLSVLLSLFSILLIYWLGTKMFNRKVGLVAAFLLSINYFSIFYAIQVRPYSLLLTLSILSYYFFYLLIFSQPKKVHFFAYLIFTVLGLYTHPWFFLLLFSQGLFLFLYPKKNRWPILLWQIASLVLSLPWLIKLIQFSQNGANSWLGDIKASAILDSFHYFSFGASLVYLGLFLLAIVLIFVNRRQKEYLDYKSLFLLNYLFSPLIIAFLISLVSPIYCVGRHEIIVLPAFILILAGLWQKLDKRVLIISFWLLAVLALNQVIAEKESIDSYTTDDRKIAVDLLEQISNNDVVIFTGLSRPPFDYYFPRFNVLNKTFRKVSFPAEMEKHPVYQNMAAMAQETNRFKQEALDLIIWLKEEESKSIWLVYDQDNPISLLLFSELQNNFSLINDADFRLSGAPLHFQRIIQFQTKP